MGTTGRRILVIDDEEDVRGYVADVLRGISFSVVEADSLAEARAALALEKFDVVVSDIHLGDGDGLELLPHIAAIAPATRVIVCSGSATIDHAIRALKDGAWDFLAKPMNKDALGSAVKRAVEARRLEEENAILVYRLAEKVTALQDAALENARITVNLQRSQSMLVEQSVALEQTVWERTSELRSSNQELATANLRLEETRDQMVRAEKMASVGTIAAGVAHEINNPIGFINSNLQTLRGYIADLKPLIEDYRRIAPPDPAIDARVRKMDLDFVLSDLEILVRESEDGVKRVVKIVKDLKTFSHSDRSAPEEANLNECIESAVNLSRNETKYVADVTTELGELPKVRSWPGQITQVLVNLIVNAAHAVQGGDGSDRRGRIAVRSRAVEGGVVLEIADDGCGIPREIASRIFDPFFTTKEPGRGTGLGLSLSYEIVERHHGEIAFDSEIGKGTTFRIHLPLAGPDAVVAPHLSRAMDSRKRESVNSDAFTRV